MTHRVSVTNCGMIAARIMGWVKMAQWGWLLRAALTYVVVLSLLYGVPSLRQLDGVAWRVAHVLAYMAFGAVLLAAIARCWPQARAHQWRLSTLLSGALFAGVGLWWLPAPWRAQIVDAWMAALLGLTLALVLPRLLPTTLTRRWLSIERRHAPRADA